MALWLTALQVIPWKEVIKHAPAVAEGAQALWSTVSGRKAAAPAPEAAGVPASSGSTEAQAISALEARLAQTTGALEALQEQMLQSSKVIKDLADQNAQLIVRIEENRRHLAWLTAGTVASAVLALVALAVVLA